MTTITSRVPARAHAPDRSGAPDPGGRRPARGGVRRALPGGRAVAGGLLVAVAAVGAFAVASGDDRPSTTYLVAAAAVPAGAPLDGAVTPAAIALPDGTAERVVPGSSVDRLAEWVAAVDLAPGDLLLRSHLVRPLAGGDGTGTGGAAGYEVAVALDPERALAGRVGAGAAVDVLATAGGCTAVLVGGAQVVTMERPGRELGGSRTVTVLRVPSQADALAVVQAADAGTITLARPGGGAAVAPADAAVATPAPVCALPGDPAAATAPGTVTP